MSFEKKEFQGLLNLEKALIPVLKKTADDVYLTLDELADIFQTNTTRANYRSTFFRNKATQALFFINFKYALIDISINFERMRQKKGIKGFARILGFRFVRN